MLTLYTGFSFSAQTDFLFDVEETFGATLSDSLGLGSFTNVDPAAVPNNHPYIARAILHHEIRLSPDLVETQRGPLQMAQQVAVRRLDLYVGKMSLLDFFDVNAIGSDSHFQFMNWALNNNAAFGYAADTRGYTYAFIAEYHDRAWALRFGQGLAPKLDNPNKVSADLAQSGSTNVEFEFHHGAVARRGGVLRVLGYSNYGLLGNFRQANQAE